MPYEVSKKAEGDHVIVSLSGATLDAQAWSPHTGRWYWGTRPATWSVSPPTTFPSYPPLIKVGVVAPETPVSEDDMAFVSSRPHPKLCYSWGACADWQSVADKVTP